MTESTPPAAPAQVPLRVGDVIAANSVMPPGSVSNGIVLLDPDGSRRIIRARGAYGFLEFGLREWLIARAAIEIPVYWGRTGTPAFSSLHRGSGYHFLPYPPADGIAIPASVDPVTPTPYLDGYHRKEGTGADVVITYIKGWLEHILTFAHEIDTLYADHTHQLRQPDSYRTLPDMPHNDESNIRNQNGLQVGRGICGHNYEQLVRWGKLRGEDGGSGSIATDWKMQMQGVREDVEAACYICDHAHWLRQFIVKHDYLAWRHALDELVVKTVGERTFSYMRLPKVDKSSEPWQPATGNITTFSGTAPLNWWKRQMVNWGEAVDEYDERYGRRTHEPT